MRRLDLDLTGSRGPRFGWILLGLALVVLADLGATWNELDAELAEAGERASRPRSGGTYPASREGRESPGALREADRIAGALTLPWDSLFRSVEEASDEHVALLVLQPDPGKRELGISGEAKDYDAILAFVTRLDRREGLRNVHLVKHEVREDDPQRPLFFSIVAGWEPRP